MSADVDAVRDVLEGVRAGWERMDGEAVLACFEEGDGTVVSGTDADEYWIGFEAFAEPFRRMADAFSNAEYHWEAGEPLVEVDGDVAWSTGRLVGTFEADGARVELPMRTTHVLRRGAGEWRIVQGHYSVPAPNATGY